jgi:hypothetical protein
MGVCGIRGNTRGRAFCKENKMIKSVKIQGDEIDVEFDDGQTIGLAFGKRRIFLHFSGFGELLVDAQPVAANQAEVTLVESRIDREETERRRRHCRELNDQLAGRGTWYSPATEPPPPAPPAPPPPPKR